MPIEFAQPQWLWVAALASAVLVVLFARAQHKRDLAVRKLAAASPDSSVARHRRWLRHGLAVLGVAMTCIALARPLAGYRWEQTPHQGVDLMFAVDTSKSMRAADLRPDRLTRAKLAVADLVRTFDGERIGLIAFAGDAFVQAPMTADRGVFLESLDALDTDVIPRGGSDLASAIRAAEQALGSEPTHRKVMVLLSDGEDLAGNAIDAARDAAKHGLTIYTVGVGSPQGELIEIANDHGVKELVRDDKGQPVRSRLDEATLRSLAQVTGGAYQPLGSDGRGLDALYESAKSQLPQSAAAGTAHKVFTERYQIPLAIALGCLVLELAIGDRRRRKRLATTTASAALGLALFALPHSADAAPAPPNRAVSSYNAGTTTYRKGDFATAQQQFEAALHTPDVALQVNSYYDLGNARYRAGQATLASKDRDATIATWKRAIEAYDAALALAPADADARFNRDFVANKLAALEEQKKQDEQKKDQNKDQQSGQGQDDQKQNGQKQNGQESGQKQNGQENGQEQNGQENGQEQNGQGANARNQQGSAAPQPNQPGQAQNDQKQSGQGQHQDTQGQGHNDPKQQGQPPNQQPGTQPKPQAGSEPQRDGKQPDREAPDAAAKAEHDGDRDATAAPSTAAQQAAAQQRAQEAAAQAASDAKHRAAGELTHGEAVRLLDSVETELKPLPIHGRTGAHPEPTTIKDW